MDRQARMLALKSSQRRRLAATGLIAAAACLLAPAAASASAVSWMLSPLAGVPTVSGAPTPGSALSSNLDRPAAVAFDPQGDLYIADTGNCTIEKVAAGTGVLSIVAGDSCSSGATPSTNPQAATSVELGTIESLAITTSGVVYLTDRSTEEVDEISGGQLSVIAGAGATVPTPTAEPATDSALQWTQAITVDTAGNLYIDDYYAVDELTTDGYIKEIAGTPVWNGSYYPSTTPEPATDENMYPIGIAVNSAGDVFVTDQGSATIDEIAGGQLWTIAGTGNSGTPTAGPALDSDLGAPAGLIGDSSGDLFFADSSSDTIDEVSHGNLSIVAGTPGVSGSPSAGPANGTNLDQPYDVAIGPSGALAIADTNNDTIDGMMPIQPTSLSAPTISGNTTLGSVLTATPGQWSYPSTAEFAYQWKRCDGSGDNCQTISGATSTTYTVTAADEGSQLEVVVTATNAGGSTAAASATVAVPVPASPPAATSSGNTAGGGPTSSKPSTKKPSKKKTKTQHVALAPKLPTNAKAAVKPAATVVRTTSASGKPGSATVGCSLTHAVIGRCQTTLTATVDGKTVVVGHGSVRGNAHHLVVTNHLTTEGMALANQPGGLKVRVDAVIKVKGLDKHLHASCSAQLTLPHVLVVPSDGMFATGSAVIEPASIPYLAKLRSELHGVRSIDCVGFTDSVGSPTSNLALGKARALAVCSYLTTGSQIPGAATSLGEADPRSSNTTASGRASNRRVEVHLNY
jgi:outer membrane protein OmpA-like peptidoglycan-associated protein/sugar lactone lactonase YvrE